MLRINSAKFWIFAIITSVAISSCEGCDPGPDIDIGKTTTFSGHATQVMFDNLKHIDQPPGSYVPTIDGKLDVIFQFLSKSGLTFSESEWLANLSTSAGTIVKVTNGLVGEIIVSIEGLELVGEGVSFTIAVSIRGTPLNAYFQESSLTQFLDPSLFNGVLNISYFANPNAPDLIVGPALVTNSWLIRKYANQFNPPIPLGIDQPFSLGFSTNMGAVGVFPSECFNCNFCIGETQISSIELGGIFINQCANTNKTFCGVKFCADDPDNPFSVASIDSSLYGFKRSNGIDQAVVEWVGKTGSPVREAHSFINQDMKVAHEYELTIFGQHQDQFLASVPSSRRKDNGTDLHWIFDAHSGLPLIGIALFMVDVIIEGFLAFGDGK